MAFISLLLAVAGAIVIVSLSPYLHWSVVAFMLPFWTYGSYQLHCRLQEMGHTSTPWFSWGGKAKARRKKASSQGSSEIQQLYARLNSLTYDWQVSQRLVDQAAINYPGKGHKWYIEKAIADIERDRYRH